MAKTNNYYQVLVLLGVLLTAVALAQDHPNAGPELNLPSHSAYATLLIGSALGLLTAVSKLLIDLNGSKKTNLPKVLGMLLASLMASFLFGIASITLGATDALLVWSPQIVAGWLGPVAFEVYLKRTFRE